MKKNVHVKFYRCWYRKLLNHRFGCNVHFARLRLTTNRFSMQLTMISIRPAAKLCNHVRYLSATALFPRTKCPQGVCRPSGWLRKGGGGTSHGFGNLENGRESGSKYDIPIFCRKSDPQRSRFANLASSFPQGIFAFLPRKFSWK